ncbi:hypothetical protein OKW30_003507 [Paraburkholderia sp. Clong3]
MSSTIPSAHGALQLLTETDPVSELVRRAVRLEAAADGRSVLRSTPTRAGPACTARCATKSRRPN